MGVGLLQTRSHRTTPAWTPVNLRDHGIRPPQSLGPHPRVHARPARAPARRDQEHYRPAKVRHPSRAGTVTSFTGEITEPHRHLQRINRPSKSELTPHLRSARDSTSASFKVQTTVHTNLAFAVLFYPAFTFCLAPIPHPSFYFVPVSRPLAASPFVSVCVPTCTACSLHPHSSPQQGSLLARFHSGTTGPQPAHRPATRPSRARSRPPRLTPRASRRLGMPPHGCHDHSVTSSSARAGPRAPHDTEDTEDASPSMAHEVHEPRPSPGRLGLTVTSPRLGRPTHTWPAPDHMAAFAYRPPSSPRPATAPLP